ncbi:hypothetical protein IPJ72_01120 [Candidatus Peregrinibacteria bacterium]|nr:MAG: hypothetical protein IPJ72_01120 [Candidatus Peregrinibacteria bacterium]
MGNWALDSAMDHMFYNWSDPIERSRLALVESTYLMSTETMQEQMAAAVAQSYQRVVNRLNQKGLTAKADQFRRSMLSSLLLLKDAPTISTLLTNEQTALTRATQNALVFERVHLANNGTYIRYPFCNQGVVQKSCLDWQTMINSLNLNSITLAGTCSLGEMVQDGTYQFGGAAQLAGMYRCAPDPNRCQGMKAGSGAGTNALPSLNTLINPTTNTQLGNTGVNNFNPQQIDQIICAAQASGNQPNIGSQSCVANAIATIRAEDIQAAGGMAACMAQEMGVNVNNPTSLRALYDMNFQSNGCGLSDQGAGDPHDPRTDAQKAEDEAEIKADLAQKAQTEFNAKQREAELKKKGMSVSVGAGGQVTISNNNGAQLILTPKPKEARTSPSDRVAIDLKLVEATKEEVDSLIAEIDPLKNFLDTKGDLTADESAARDSLLGATNGVKKLPIYGYLEDGDEEACNAAVRMAVQAMDTCMNQELTRVANGLGGVMGADRVRAFGGSRNPLTERSTDEGYDYSAGQTDPIAQCMNLGYQGTNSRQGGMCQLVTCMDGTNNCCNNQSILDPGVIQAMRDQLNCLSMRCVDESCSCVGVPAGSSAPEGPLPPRPVDLNWNDPFQNPDSMPIEQGNENPGRPLGGRWP